MQYPKIETAVPTENYTLVIEFDNQQIKEYDVTPLLENEMFYPLKEPSFFKNVRVESGGYAVVWNADIDISEYELWMRGEFI